MAVITYIAKDRGALRIGHSAGTEYTFEIPFSAWTPDDNFEKNTHRSLSGRRVSVLYHILKTYSFTTVGTSDPTELANLDEFFSSVANDEVFTLDVFGTIATPNNPENFILDGSPKPARVNYLDLSFSGKVEKPL